MNGLQRLPKNEEIVILELVRANNLPVSKLRCDYTRQQGQGVGHSHRGWSYDISYDLMLCKWCGNLEGSRNNSPYCPHKLGALKTRMLEA